MLLRRISTLFGRKAADSDTIDEWHRALIDIDPIEAFNALDRILQAGEAGPSASRLMAEIRGRVPVVHKDPGPLGKEDCAMCDGTGLMAVHEPPDPINVTRMAPCYLCRPDHSWHKRRQRNTTTIEPAYAGPTDAGRRTIADIRKTLGDRFRAPDGAA